MPSRRVQSSIQAEDPLRTSLFRQEAVEGLRPRLEGPVLAIQPVAFVRVARVFVALALCAIVAASLISAPMYLTVAGQLQPDSGMMTMRAPATGLLELAVPHNAEAVKQGQVLATVRSNESLGSGAAVVDAKRKALEARRQAQSLAIDGDISAARQEVRRLERQIDGVRAVLVTDKSAVAAAQELQGIADKQLARARTLLDSGLVTKQSVEDQERACAERRMAVIQASQAHRRSESEVLQLEAQLSAAQAKIQSALSQGAASLAAADSDLVDLDQRSSQSIVAPYAGNLSAFYARPGPVQRDDILFVLSSSDTIEAIAVVPEAVAQKLTVGTRAAVNVYGTSSLDLKVSEGTLTEVSSGVVAMPILGEPQVGHIARISIKRPAFKLSPGTRVSIKLQSKEQRLISWLFPALNS